MYILFKKRSRRGVDTLEFTLKERLYELLRNPKEFLQDGEKLILEKDGMRIVLFNDGEQLSLCEEYDASFQIEVLSDTVSMLSPLMMENKKLKKEDEYLRKARKWGE